MKRKLEAGGVDVHPEIRDLPPRRPGDRDDSRGAVLTFGLRIKAAMEGPVRIVWGYANYSAGYIVERQEYGKGYESMQTPFPQGEAELYVDQIIEDLRGESL